MPPSSRPTPARCVPSQGLSSRPPAPGRLRDRRLRREAQDLQRRRCGLPRRGGGRWPGRDAGLRGYSPKAGRTVFDTWLDLGIPSPHTLHEVEASLNEHGFAATSVKHYLPELHALLELRWEMARRTVLSVAEKMVSPVPGSRFLVGVTHRPFLESVARALVDLRVEHALVVQAIEGSDEAPLDGYSALVRVRDDELEEFRVPPESLGLLKVTRADIISRGPEHETRHVLGALGSEEGPVRDLILYNAALRLWVADEAVPLAEHLENSRAALYSGEALELVDRLGGRVPASG